MKSLNINPNGLLVYSESLIKLLDKKYSPLFGKINESDVINRLEELKRLGRNISGLRFKATKITEPFYDNMYKTIQQLYTSAAMHHNLPESNFYTVQKISGQKADPLNVSFLKTTSPGLREIIGSGMSGLKKKPCVTKIKMSDALKGSGRKKRPSKKPKKNRVKDENEETTLTKLLEEISMGL